VLDKPTIQYVVEEAAAAGVGEVLLVSSPAKRAVEKHFQPDSELEERLKTPDKAALIASIDQLIAKVKVRAVDQPRQLGLGDAVRYARDFAGGEAFICMLGDTIFSGDLLPAEQLIEAHRRFGAAIIGLEEVPPDKVERYGIAGGREIEAGVLKLDTLVEKPSLASAPSRLAIAARYVLTPAIFDCIDRTSPGKGGEIQLTDAIRLLMEREEVFGVALRARRHDIGNPLEWLRTNLIFAARDEKLWEQIAPLARSLLDEHDHRGR
jgi:UTP--glucose-1-phosphate uridylyltransferase